MSAYTASKFAVLGLVESVRLEVRIRLNAAAQSEQLAGYMHIAPVQLVVLGMVMSLS